MVFRANRSFFDKKKQIALFTLFVKRDEKELLFLKSDTNALVSLLNRAINSLLFFIKAKPKINF